MRSLKYLFGAIVLIGAAIVLTIAKSNGLISDDKEQWRGYEEDKDNR
jgi:hypothetical protein